MSPRRLLSVLVPAAIITLAIAVSAQAPPGTTSGSASDPNVLTNQSIIEMAAKLPEEVIIAKMQTSKIKFDLSTPALAELKNSGVSANIVKAMMTPKNAPPRRGESQISDEGENMKRPLGKIATAFLVLVLAAGAATRAPAQTLNRVARPHCWGPAL